MTTATTDTTAGTTTDPETGSPWIKSTLLLKSVVFIFFLFRYTKSNHKKTSHRLITGERSNYFISSSAQQQQPAVPQPIITTTVTIIMLLMLLKNGLI